MLAIYKYMMRISSKIFPASLSKDIKTFFIKALCCHIAIPSNWLPLKTLYLISLPLLIKLITDQLLFLFRCKFWYVFCSLQLHQRCLSNQRFLLLLMICCCYAANYNAKGAFVIILFICSDLLNCNRSICTIAIATENA